jgi:hypothetical protein
MISLSSLVSKKCEYLFHSILINAVSWLPGLFDVDNDILLGISYLYLFRGLFK